MSTNSISLRGAEQNLEGTIGQTIRRYLQVNDQEGNLIDLGAAGITVTGDVLDSDGVSVESWSVAITDGVAIFTLSAAKTTSIGEQSGLGYAFKVTESGVVNYYIEGSFELFPPGSPHKLRHRSGLADEAQVVVSGGTTLTLTAATPLTLLDEDDFASDSAVKPPSQQSTKAFIEAALAGKIQFATSPPVSPSEGDIWVDSSTMDAYAWYEDGSSSQWVLISSVSALAATDPVVFASDPGAQAVLDSRYASSVQRSLVSPRHLRRWYDALALAHSAKATVAIHGDSIALGAYAGVNAEAWQVNGVAAQIRRRFAAIYGNTGPGAVKATTEYDGVSLSGGSTSSTTGPTQQGRSIGAGNTITVALDDACTGFDVCYWQGGGSFSWAVDGGGATTVTPSSADEMAVVQITGLDDEAHSLVLTGIGTAHIGWIRPTRGTTGVVVDRFARSGATANHLAFATTPSSNRTRILDASFEQPGADLNIIILGANDIAAEVPTPADFKTLLEAATDAVTAAGGCTLLVAGPRYASESGSYTQADYYDKMAEIAVADDHVAFVDLMDSWASFANVNQSDLDFMHDTIHPNAAGHASFADFLLTSILAPQPVA